MNTSIRFGDRFVLKLVRNIETGPNPGVEFGQFPYRKRKTRPSPTRRLSSATWNTSADSRRASTLAFSMALSQTKERLAAYPERIERVLRSGCSNPKHSIADLQKSAPTNFYALRFVLAAPPPIATRNSSVPICLSPS